VVKRSEKRASTAAGQPGELLVFDEFHPYPFRQFASKQVDEYPTFNKVNIVAGDGACYHNYFMYSDTLLFSDTPYLLASENMALITVLCILFVVFNYIILTVWDI